ncbi:Pectinesterase [Quillaja saponaria]|uniref:Pectinesterase n=1 Tax=Quillaja saponaria TaxID=32244 RepID=A0AAD7LCU3_QUISA|nr:Pectinesterase [Quillaja saponaria]
MAPSILKLFLLLSTIFFNQIWAFNSNASTTSLNPNLSSIRSFCKTTPYPDVCFNSLKLSISINIGPDILKYLLHSLQISISEATKLSDLFNNAGHSNIIENQKGAIQDCKELHQITLSSLQRSVSKIKAPNSRKLADANAYLSAALTNKNTCLEGLDSASGPLKPVLVNSLVETYKHVSNSLSMLSRPGIGAAKPKGHKNRRLMGFPSWMSRKARWILQSTDGDEYDPTEVLTVAADGTGNFTTITDAISFAPNNSFDRTIIFVKKGVYEENVEIPSYKTNIVLLGDGSDVTFIIGNRNVVDGWTTFRSATLAVSGEGFLARDIRIENRAGPEKHQAVALRVNSDLSALYRCTINGYQDTLYVHSFRQFYRECNISGTIDYIFGNAAVVFQACNILSRMPMPGQFTVITAQSRDIPDENTGISIQNCSILAADDLYSNSRSVKSYLGRPWRIYSQTVYIESYIDDFIDPTGWKEWSGDDGLDTLYYGEYGNYGPGSGTDNRVSWLGYRKMEYDEASDFSVSEFISGDAWLESTSFPYDDQI